ncbi:MAG: putative toxin-antitoxin system toxin component, PIN family [Desulfobacteraceae bacterium]
MKNLVIDCNVFISAFIGSDICFQAIDKAFSDYRVCYSEATRKELLETLKRPKFQYIRKAERIEMTLQVLHLLGAFFTPEPCGIKLPDPDDAIYLDLAITAHAEFIITGNKKHFPENLCKGIQILSPSEFLKLQASL